MGEEGGSESPEDPSISLVPTVCPVPPSPHLPPSALTATQGGGREMGTLPPYDIGKRIVRGEVGTLTQDQSHHARDIGCKGEVPRGAGREMGTCT